MSSLIETLTAREPNPNIPPLRSGDTVRVHNRIVEGDRERIQVFQGVVMRLSGSGANARFTVRRIAAHGVGVERTFFLASPRLEKVEILRHAHVRRKQLYYLRGRRGKAARLRDKRFVRSEELAAKEASASEAEA
ncbi:MAG: 50S ribosomal protein L19 [Anaerolineae bacterium]